MLGAQSCAVITKFRYDSPGGNPPGVLPRTPDTGFAFRLAEVRMAAQGHPVAKLFKRARTDNRYFNDWMPGPGLVAKHFVPVAIDGGETAHVSGVTTRERWITQGEPREIIWGGGKATAYFFPYDHIPGGTLYVPDEVPSGATVTLPEAAITTILR